MWQNNLSENCMYECMKTFSRIYYRQIVCVDDAHSLKGTRTWSTACWITEPMWTSWMMMGFLHWSSASSISTQSPSLLSPPTRSPSPVRPHTVCLLSKNTSSSTQFVVFCTCLGICVCLRESICVHTCPYPSVYVSTCFSVSVVHWCCYNAVSTAAREGSPWLGSVVIRASDSWSKDYWFGSQPVH